jgi:RimJ/RimL family protein N-acetyltransferase
VIDPRSGTSLVIVPAGERRTETIAVVAAHEWPHHGVPRLDSSDAERVIDAAESWAIVEAGVVVGVLRILDLDDIEDGSPLFDLRLAATARGRGIGTAAVTWLADHLFATYPSLHRIEATTRDDNLAMQRVLDRCGWTCEGRMRESWPTPDGTRHDALVYGLLRTDERPAVRA